MSQEGEQDEKITSPLLLSEVNKLRDWIEEDILGKAKAETKEEENEAVSCDPLIVATTKPCPNCKFRATHAHGHACHHICES